MLHLRYPSLLVKFAQRLHELAGASGEAAIESLVIMGDFPDYTLARWETCHRNMREFFDAIVLGAYDAGKVRRFLFGSTAQKILDSTDVPLIFGV